MLGDSEFTNVVWTFHKNLTTDLHLFLDVCSCWNDRANVVSDTSPSPVVAELFTPGGWFVANSGGHYRDIAVVWLS